MTTEKARQEQMDRIEAMLRWVMERQGYVNVDEWLKEWAEDREFERSKRAVKTAQSVWPVR